MGYISSMVHRFVRRNTTRIPEETARKWKTRLSLAYMFVGWNLFGMVLYMTSTGRGDWPAYYGLKTEEEANQQSHEYFTQLLGIEKARVVKFKGFTKVEDFEYENPKMKSKKEEEVQQ